MYNNKDDNIHKSEALKLFMDILTFLGLYNTVASLMILYFVVPEMNIPKTRSNGLLENYLF